jgi:hypothetical protein
MLKLLTTNIDAFRETIPFIYLVRKFGEVMDLATSIGMRYVWIDTLCIIQDSREDWRKEAGRIAALYQNATINFARVGSSATDVCLKSRNVLGLSRACFSVEHPEPGLIPLYLSRSNALVGRMFSLAKERPPVLKRGWIWQERFLSRRTIYLGETQLVWECRYRLWLESAGFKVHFDNLPIWTYVKRTLHGSVPRNWNFLPDQEGANGLVRWKLHWDGFTVGYTDAALTFTTDKLAAVAGISRAFQSASGHVRCGHVERAYTPWVVVVEDGFEREKARVPGAPSRSWAAADGGLSYAAVFVGREGHKLHVPGMVLVGLNGILGEVREAVVRVKGRLLGPSMYLQTKGRS